MLLTLLWCSFNINLKQKWLLAAWNKIQTHKRFKRMLFIRTKHNMQIFRVLGQNAQIFRVLGQNTTCKLSGYSKALLSVCKRLRDADWESLGRIQCCKYASWQNSSKPRSGKGIPFLVSMRHSCQNNFRKHCQEWLAGKTVRDQASHSRKHQTAKSLGVHWWLLNQRPVIVGFHCQARCDHHSWRQCSLYGLNLQLDNGGGSSLPCLIAWIASSQEVTDHT